MSQHHPRFPYPECISVPDEYSDNVHDLTLLPDDSVEALDEYGKFNMNHLKLRLRSSPLKSKEEPKKLPGHFNSQPLKNDDSCGKITLTILFLLSIVLFVLLVGFYIHQHASQAVFLVYASMNITFAVLFVMRLHLSEIEQNHSATALHQSSAPQVPQRHFVSSPTSPVISRRRSPLQHSFFPYTPSSISTFQNL